MNPENLAKAALGIQPVIFGLTLTEIDLLLRIVLTCVGIASGGAASIYYRAKTKRERDAEVMLMFCAACFFRMDASP